MDDAPKGFGTRVFASQVKAAVESGGYRRIATHAAGDIEDTTFNGYYTWPRLGYDAPLRRAEIELLPANLQHSRTVLDIMATPEGRAWWKENGTGRDMVFDLAENSRSRRTLDAYLKEQDIQL